jgi:hypothetical protein
MNMTTYGDCGSETASVAATATLLATITVLPEGKYRIKKIRLSAGNVTANEPPAPGFVEIKIDKVAGIFKFPVFVSLGVVTSGASVARAEEIDVEIPVPGSAQVKIYITTKYAVEFVAGIIYTD